jgi:hypothetical protein
MLAEEREQIHMLITNIAVTWDGMGLHIDLYI